MAKGIREKISWFLLLVLVTSIPLRRTNVQAGKTGTEKIRSSCSPARDLKEAKIK